MDHKVSKDMISSGMIPSGEKTQADLGKIQYGSAPSPNKLMDAYYSMYQDQKEQTLDEKVGGLGKVPKKGGGGITPKKPEGGITRKTQPVSFKDFKAAVKDQPRNEKDAKRERLQGIMSKYGESVDLLAAYRAVYEHHKKDEDGNTIPHDGEELDENLASIAAKGLQMASRGASKVGQMAAKGSVRAKQLQTQGGVKKAIGDKLQSAKKKLALTSGQKQALLGRTTAGKITRGVGALAAANIAGRMTGGGDKPNYGYDGYSNNPAYLNFDYAPDGDTISEDLFDALKFLLTEEGYDEKTTMKIIASMDTDFINESLSEENLDEALPLLALAPLLAKGAMAAKAGLAAAKATKVGMAAIKGAKALGAAGKAFGKGLTTAGAKGASASKITTSGGKLASGTAKVGKAQKAGQMVRGGLAAMKNNPTNTVMGAAMAPSLMPQKAPPTPQTQRAVTSGKRTAGMQRMDLDLFDVVKGQLLDEGLTEEECNDVMTTLTLEEINETLQLDEISGKLAMKASRAADMKRAQLAKAGDKAGAAAKSDQSKRLYKKGAERNLAKQDLSKPLNPQRKDYPMGKGGSYQEKPGM